MDEFLIPHANFKRLYEEFKRYGSLAIGVDFDNTIYDYHKKGYKCDAIIDLIIRAQTLGNKIHIFTANPDHILVSEHCAEKGIQIEGINTGFDLGWESRKPFYNILLDDRAGLISAYDDLLQVVNVLEMEMWEEQEFDDQTHISN